MNRFFKTIFLASFLVVSTYETTPLFANQNSQTVVIAHKDCLTALGALTTEGAALLAEETEARIARRTSRFNNDNPIDDFLVPEVPDQLPPQNQPSVRFSLESLFLEPIAEEFILIARTVFKRLTDYHFELYWGQIKNARALGGNGQSVYGFDSEGFPDRPYLQQVIKDPEVKSFLKERYELHFLQMKALEEAYAELKSKRPNLKKDADKKWRAFTKLREAEIKAAESGEAQTEAAESGESEITAGESEDVEIAAPEKSGSKKKNEPKMRVGTPSWEVLELPHLDIFDRIRSGKLITRDSQDAEINLLTHLGEWAKVPGFKLGEDKKLTNEEVVQKLQQLFIDAVSNREIHTDQKRINKLAIPGFSYSEEELTKMMLKSVSDFYLAKTLPKLEALIGEGIDSALREIREDLKSDPRHIHWSILKNKIRGIMTELENNLNQVLPLDAIKENYQLAKVMREKWLREFTDALTQIGINNPSEALQQYLTDYQNFIKRDDISVTVQPSGSKKVHETLSAIIKRRTSEYNLADTLRIQLENLQKIINGLDEGWNAIESGLRSASHEFTLAGRAHVEYVKELGTAIIHSSNGIAPNLNIPVYMLVHGSGGARSNILSWLRIVPRVGPAGNCFGFTRPNAGPYPCHGMETKGLLLNAAYHEFVYRWIKNRVKSAITSKTTGAELKGKDQKWSDHLPFIHLGRSSGGFEGFVHAFLYRDDADPSVDFYINHSFSNPETMKKQDERLKAKLDQGVIAYVAQQDLDSLDAMSEDLLALLKDVYQKNPAVFEYFGDHILNPQGDADGDGGPTVVEDLEHFTTKYSPLAHNYVVRNPLFKKYPHILEDFQKNIHVKGDGTFPNEAQQGNHFLFNAFVNMSPEKAKELFPGVDEADLPKLSDQMYEMLALHFGFMDYLINSPMIDAGDQRAILLSKKLSRFRRDSLGVNADGSDRTFINYYLLTRKVKLEDFDKLEPGDQSIASRIKRVAEFWEAEKVRVRQYLVEKGRISAPPAPEASTAP